MASTLWAAVKVKSVREARHMGRALGISFGHDLQQSLPVMRIYLLITWGTNTMEIVY